MDEQPPPVLGNLPDELSLIPQVFLADSRALQEGAIAAVIADALRAIRLYLDMEVAFVAEFSEGRRWFRHVDTAWEGCPVEVGGSDPLGQTYCQRVVEGRLPPLIQDATLLSAALELSVTRDLPVGAHLSIPLYLSDGQVYGTFCCFSRQPNFTLGERDLAIMRLFANFTTRQIERDLSASQVQREMAERVTAALEPDALTIVYQPIVNLLDHTIIGFEALTRFGPRPRRSPDVWFNEASQVGLGERLEMAAIAKALVALKDMPPDLYLSLNVSPGNILNQAMHRALQGQQLDRILLEVTEHVAIPDYSQFNQVLQPLRRQGLRLAVDDAGAGYASFRHILQLQPDVIKLDTALIRNIDTDNTRRALTVALGGFARETGSIIVAEGVETPAELTVLHQLRVNKAQGYLLGYPLPLEQALALV
jgi:EAL domain-containing protein (putative c-di-GMP-specific phosphodiesterase class I)